MATVMHPEQVAELERLRARVHELEHVIERGRAAVSAAEQNLRTVLDFAPEAIAMLDVATGRFIDVNPRTEQMFGLTREQLLQVGPLELSPPNQPNGPSAERCQEYIEQALSGEPTKCDWWFRNARGERFLTEIYAVRMPNSDRQILHGTIVDIGARKHLQLSERGRSRVLEGIARGESLNSIFNALTITIESLLPEMLCSILLIDQGQQVLRVGAAPNMPAFYSAAIDGVSIGPAVGSCGAAAHSRQRVIVSDISTHPNWEKFRDLAKQAHLGACWSEPIFSFDGRVLGTFAMYYAEPTEPAAVELRAIEIASYLATLAIEHDHARRSLHELNATLERRVIEKTNHLLEFNQKLVSADEQLAANQDIRKREAALAHSERLATMGQMAAEFAHELNQPLYAISNFAAVTQEWLRGLSGSGIDATEAQRWNEQISQQSQRAGEMIRRVLQFVRKGELNRQRLDLNYMIRELALLLQFGMRSKLIDLEFEFAENLGLVEVDRMLIEQVLVNLVRNAAEAMQSTPPEKRRLVVRTFQAEEHMVGVAVSDTGQGLLPEHLERLFEPYFTTKKNGSGMGLPICRSTIDAHHGRIWAANNPSGGATFQFTLPMAAKELKVPVGTVSRGDELSSSR